MTTDDLRRQMLSVVFGWDADIRDLIRDELRHHVPGSRSAAYLSKWLNDDPEQLASFIGTNESTPDQDWIVLALSGLSPKSNRKAVQAFAQKNARYGGKLILPQLFCWQSVIGTKRSRFTSRGTTTLKQFCLLALLPHTIGNDSRILSGNGASMSSRIPSSN